MLIKSKVEPQKIDRVDAKDLRGFQNLEGLQPPCADAGFEQQTKNLGGLCEILRYAQDDSPKMGVAVFVSAQVSDSNV
jgi:hypothetical protein